MRTFLHKHRHNNGCVKLAEQKKQWLDNNAKTYVDIFKPQLFLKHGIMRRSELPTHRMLKKNEDETWWHNYNCFNLFRSTKYMDGSCVPCQQCPYVSRAGDGVVTV